MRMEFPRPAMSAPLALVLAAGPGFAAPSPALGIVVAGAFRLNHATVRGNATLFEGAIVETGPAPARVDLTGGGRLELEPESAGRLRGGHLVLEQGAIHIARSVSPSKSVTGFNPALAIDARGLTIQPSSNAAAGRIVLVGPGRVEVSALAGAFRVHNAGGALVAIVTAGNALALEPRPTPGPARMTGRLLRPGNHYLLTDETTKITVELNGSAETAPNLVRRLGQRVEVTGSTQLGAIPASDAAQVIEVTQVAPAPPPSGNAPAGNTPAGTPADSGGPGGAAPAGAGGATGGAAAGRAISVTMVAVIGGVAAAAVVGGLAASGKLTGSGATPLSR